jgi:hypothetical protein
MATLRCAEHGIEPNIIFELSLQRKGAATDTKMVLILTGSSGDRFTEAAVSLWHRN